MPASLQEIDEFADFAKQSLDSGFASLSLEDCVRLWREQQDKQESVRSILQSLEEDDVGLSQPLSEAFDDVRRQLGIAR